MKVEQFKDSNILYLSNKDTLGDENIVMMNKFKDELNQNDLFIEDTVIYGVLTFDNESSIYNIAIINNNDITVNGLEKGTLSGGKYAVFELEHTKEAIIEF